jgi:DNA-binding IclR family transcriptional regulator
MSTTANTTKSAQPVLSVLEALCGFAEEGATNKDLATACKTTAVAITRATQTLIAYGWCRKSDETGRFYPTAQFTRLSFKVSDSFERAQRRLDDRRHSMTSGF